MKRIAIWFVALGLCLLVSTGAQAQVGYVGYDSAAVAYCAPPVAVSTYYAPAPAVVYQPTAVVRTRWRPLLGGSVTRVRYGYAPVVYAAPRWW